LRSVCASQAFQVYPMRKIFFLTVVLFSCIWPKSKAQTALPLSAGKPIWNIGQMTYGRNVLDVLVFIEKDTIFCQKQWTVANFGSMNKKVARSVYYRQEEGKVYFKPSFVCEEREYLMYDYNMKPGDTLSVPIRLFELERVTANRVIVRVDSVSNVTVNGVSRKRMLVNYQRVGNPPRRDPYLDRRDVWLEGIGSLIFPLYPFICVSLNECNEAESYVRCFQANNKVIYQSPVQPFCSNTLITSSSDVQNPKITLNIFPNPLPQGGNWQVEWAINEAHAAQLELVDPLGRVVKQVAGLDQNSMQRVQVPSENLPKGLYYLRLKDEKGQVLALEKVLVQ
jgi:Secretion system C-terminal sorting domain